MGETEREESGRQTGKGGSCTLVIPVRQEDTQRMPSSPEVGTNSHD